jgi:hypothetical protein
MSSPAGKVSPGNSLDVKDLIKRLDPAALTEQYKELLGKFSLPNLDTKALMEPRARTFRH